MRFGVEPPASATLKRPRASVLSRAISMKRIAAARATSDASAKICRFGVARSAGIELLTLRVDLNGFDGATRCAIERGLVVEDDAHGDVADERGHAPLVPERSHERAVLQFLDQFGRDAAADVEAARRCQYQAEVARHRSVNFRKEVEGFDGQLRLAAETCDGDGSRTVAAFDLFGQPGGGSAASMLA